MQTSTILSHYENCTQCPRKCKVNRNEGKKGFCNEDSTLRISVATLHFGEEPPVTVFNGSGTIFFTGCNLRCAFCQNYQISQDGMGKEVSTEEFAEICLALQNKGAENINLVTPSHHIPKIAAGLLEAKKQGLNIPICYNSSGYESVEYLQMLEGLVTIWLPDLKTLNSALSKELCAAEDYPEVAKKAISWMISKNPLKFQTITKNGEQKDKLLQGVIIRHLFLPGRFEETAEVLQWLKENADSKALLSLMNQYTPVPFAENPEKLKIRREKLKSIENRLVSTTEDEDLQDLISAFDFEYLFYQELSTDTDWLPDFQKKQPFSNKLAKPVWHWNYGFI